MTSIIISHSAIKKSAAFACDARIHLRDDHLDAAMIGPLSIYWEAKSILPASL